MPSGEDEWWLRWRPGSRELITLPGCTMRDTESTPADPQPCLLFTDHASPHTFEFDYRIRQDRQGLLHRALTVGDLSKAIADLDDDTAIRIGAVTTGVLADVDFDVLLLAVAEATLPYTSAGGQVDPALVLLIGLNCMHPSAEKN